MEFRNLYIALFVIKLPVLLFIFPPFDRACFSLRYANLVKRRANGNLPNDGVRVNGQTFVSGMTNLSKVQQLFLNATNR